MKVEPCFTGNASPLPEISVFAEGAGLRAGEQVDSSPAPRKRVLLVDDDASVRESLSQVLESEQYEVLTAWNGLDALSKIAGNRPDLVLLDLNMPGMDGWRAFDLIEQSHPLMRVVVITARPNQYARAAGVGIDALMEKPLDLPLLLRTIARLLAEAEPDRVARLTSREFKTEYLPPRRL
jgi:two-component system response regulator MprA